MTAADVIGYAECIERSLARGVGGNHCIAPRPLCECNDNQCNRMLPITWEEYAAIGDRLSEDGEPVYVLRAGCPTETSDEVLETGEGWVAVRDKP